MNYHESVESFGQRDILAYVISQLLFVSLMGFLVAMWVALLFIQSLKMEVMGMTLEPAMDSSVIANALALTMIIGLLAGAYPAGLAARLNIA